MKEPKYRKARIRPDKNAPKRRPGRPEHVPTDKDRTQVKIMAIVGTEHPLIARVIGVAEATLRKYYREELDTSLVRANSAVAANLHRIATGNGPAASSAAQFWLARRAGWVPKQEVTGAGGGPLQIVIAKDDFDL